MVENNKKQSDVAKPMGRREAAVVFEKEKTREQRAEDIAYTINHSIYCTITDFINPPVNAATDGWLRYIIPGCGCDHSGAEPIKISVPHVHGPECNHGKHEPPKKNILPIVDLQHKDNHKHNHPPGEVCTEHFHAPANATRWEKTKLALKHMVSKERLLRFAKGEFIGDFGAVPITIAAQRLLPGVMDGLRRVAEPVMRPIFKWGIETDSKRWAKKNAVATDSQEYKDHVKEVYEHEMKHFPQAMVWTGSSMALNVAYQMHKDTSDLSLIKKLGLASGSVLGGITVTAAMVVAARSLAPRKVREFDQWNSANVILPVTKVIGKVFGVDEEAVDRMRQKQDEFNGWAERVAKPEADVSKGIG